MGFVSCHQSLLLNLSWAKSRWQEEPQKITKKREKNQEDATQKQNRKDQTWIITRHPRWERERNVRTTMLTLTVRRLPQEEKGSGCCCCWCLASTLMANSNCDGSIMATSCESLTAEKGNQKKRFFSFLLWFPETVSVRILCLRRKPPTIIVNRMMEIMIMK